MNYEERPHKYPETEIKRTEARNSHTLLLMLMAAISAMIFATTADAKTQKPPKSPRKSSAVMETSRARTIRLLRETYNITVEIDRTPRLEKDYTATLLSETDSEDMLHQLEEALSCYPQEDMRKMRAANLRIYILDRLHKGTIKLFGIFDNHQTLVLTKEYLGPTFHHEWFHWLDKADGQDNDDAFWISLNPDREKAYRYPTTDAALKALQREEIPSGPPLKGFANRKGQYQGPNEDQAVTAEALFDEAQRGRLLKRAATDPTLRRKIEAITGCTFDPETRRFETTMSEIIYTYRLNAPDGIQYYGKWFRDRKGKPLMNHLYWNTLIDGEKPSRKQ